MFGKLLKPAWQSDSAERRIIAIKKLKPDNPKDLLILDSLVTDDPEQIVRKAAIDAIADPKHVFGLFQNCQKSSNRQNIELGFIQLIGNQSKLKQDDYLALIGTHTNSAPYVLQHCPISEIREQLIEDFTEDQLAEFLADIDYAETRIKVAQQIETEHALETARKHLKAKDKNALKIIKSKLDVIRSRQRAQTDADNQAEEVCSKLRFLSEHEDWRKEFTPQFNLWVERWSAITPSPNETLCQQFLKLKTEVALRVEAVEQEQALRQQTKAYLDQLQAQLTKLNTSTIEQLVQNQQANCKNFEELSQRWQSLVVERTPSPKEIVLFEELNAALQSALDAVSILTNASAIKPADANVLQVDTVENDKTEALKKALSLIKQHKRLKTSETRKELEELLSLGRQQRAAAKMEHQQGLKKLHQRISRLISSGEKGNLHIAQKELVATQKLAEPYIGTDKKSLDERLAKATESVEKLSDWHRFATEPKFIDLCQSMEKLATKEVSKKLHPDNLAQKIRKLQNEWKKLGVLHDETLWNRFKEAADQAFIPCAEFFSERDQIRNENLNKREPIIADITALFNDTDWHNEPDYRALETRLKKAHQQWQKIKNVPREEGDKQWQRYRTLRQQVFDKLAVEYDKNNELQKQLIQQSEKLLSNGIDTNSFEKLKHLQSSWKQLGITRPKDDRNCWKKFKQSTDAAFTAIKDHDRAKNDKYDDMLAEHHQIIKTLDKLAKQNEASDSIVEDLEQQFHDLATLPRDFPEAKLNSVEKSYKRALGNYRKSRERQRRAAQREQATLIQRKASLCAELELAYSASKLNQELIDDLSAQLEDGQILDKNTEKRLNDRIESAAQQDRENFDEQRRILCITIEILSNIESPKEDRSLRTQMQLEAMSNKGLGASAQAQSIEQLKLDWLCLPGAQPKLQEKFENRLKNLFRTND